MKKIYILALAFAGLTSAVFAQKGTILAYGSVQVNSKKDNAGLKNTSFTIAPGIGYQFHNNWTTGINLTFIGTKSELAAPNTGNFNKVSGFAVGPFVRYTKNLSNIFSIFVHGNFNYVSATSKPYSTTPVTPLKATGFRGEILPAVAINVKNGFALNFGFGSLSYSTIKSTLAGSKSTSDFGVTFGNEVNIGVSKNFSLKKKK